jgi:hypothetical protein
MNSTLLSSAAAEIASGNLGVVLLTGMAVLLTSIAFFLRGSGFMKIKQDTVKSSAVAPRPKKKLGPICPFSDQSNFLVEVAENMSPTPIDLFESWIDPDSIDFGRPISARWLNAGLSGQDTPGMLRAGLKRLPNAKNFLVEEPFRIRQELLMKEKALDNPKKKALVFVEEKESLDAQHELLELFLGYLPKRYPDLYQYVKDANTIHVVPLDRTFKVDDWMDRPLELCERIVQEDLILMRPPRAGDKSEQFAMAAAAVVFSFSELPEKLGKPVAFIHAPVPGYEKHIRKSLDLTFKKLLKVEQPMWRNNWGIAPSGRLDEPLYGSTAAHNHRKFSTPTRDEIKSKFLKVEYQTIRRLPRTQNLLFTVKTMADPISSLEEVPQAASCLARSIRGMSTEMRAYKGIESDETCVAVLDYLDSIGVSTEKQ